MDSETQDTIYEILDKVNDIQSRLQTIEAHLGIVPDLDVEIIDVDSSITNFRLFCKTQLKLSDRTIKLYSDYIHDFLEFSQGQVNIEAVDIFLKHNDSQHWKNQQIKALRAYCKKFLSLGSWIDGFEIINTDKVNKKQHATDFELSEFFHSLRGYSQLVFLMLHDSGLRLDEILKVWLQDIDFDYNCIDVTEKHQGETKTSYISFFTDYTKTILRTYVKDNMSYFNTNMPMFPISARGVEIEFQRASNDLGLQITPKDLRSIFVRKLTNAGIRDRYIDSFQGRISKSIMAKHYTDYSKDNLFKQYKKAMNDLQLPI